MKNTTLLLGFLWLVTITDSQSFAQDYKIIVNAANPTSSLTKQQVRDMFLRKVTTWEHGPKILPADLDIAVKVREKFSKEIHGKSAAAVESYWQQKIFSGRGTPPPQKTSEKEALDYVERNAGAIGYVSVTAAVEKVKVLEITD